MGYRTFEHKPKPKRRTMQKTVTPHRVYMQNGTTAIMAIPCFYQIAHEPIRMKPHNRPMHDHMGWPDPRRRDRSCQLYEPYEAGYPPEPEHTRMGGRPPVRKLLDAKRLIPIHLSSDYEGYTKFKVYIEQPAGPEGIWAEAKISEDQDWVVLVRFGSELKPSETRTFKFSVYAISERNWDLLAMGELVVLPAYLEVPE